jgi:hypothetical protein
MAAAPLAANVVPFPGAQPGPAVREKPYEPPRSITKLKKQFTAASAAKTEENREAAEAERYFHGVQWTSEQLKALKERNQPPVTFNRIKRKINTICGIIEKLRQDPKAYARNPQRQAEDGAEVATKTLRYALGWDWTDKSVNVARRCAVRGISGAELVLVPGDQGDPDLEWDTVDQRDFFYDPASVKPDFSDARYLGTTRWIDLDEAIDQFPDYEDELRDYVERNPVSDIERGDERHEMRWCDSERKRIRLVEHWYMVGTKWHYCLYCSETVLESGPTYLKDEKGKDCHKYEMLSFEVDQDGDRYGAFRDLKSPQDEVNQRRSKSLHQLNSRKIIADEGAVDDVEAARREFARADGWVVKNPGKEIIPEDAQAKSVVDGNMQLLAEAKAEIDTYGPNPGLVGTEIPADSGRAIALLQAAGIAELGSYMTSYRTWKTRLYRKTWNAQQQHWTAPRWIRVTDDENLGAFIQVNGWEKDPATGQVKILNQLAALDVDIILDEGQDTVTSTQDTFETVTLLAKSGAPVPPEMIIELSPLPSSTKQRIMQQIAASQQQNPLQQQAMQLQLQMLQAQIAQLMSQVQLNQAKAQQAGADAQATMIEAQTPDPAPQVDTAADMAKAGLDQAKADEIRHKIAVGTHVPETMPPPPPPPPVEPGLFEVNVARARREHAQAGAAEASQLKTLLEARTIDEAPPGMLTKPPARPTSVPQTGRSPAR